MLRCECGYLARGDTEDALVEDAQRHALTAHGMDISRERILALARKEG